MKAERRHQLQNNELAKPLETLPEKLQRHASKIILAVTLIVLGVFLYRYRVNTAFNRQTALANATMTAQIGPRQLRSLDGQYFPPEQLASYRSQITSEVNSAIDTILREAEGDDGAPLRAEALVAKGDLNWALANLGILPGAATQPTLALKPSEDYLKAAENAYRDVVSAYAGQTIAWVSAQFGLAAIAENRKDWPAATAAYTAVINHKSVPVGFQAQARAQLVLMEQIKGPVLLAEYPATAPTTHAGTQPSADIAAAEAAPLTPPATAPSK